MTVVVRLDPPNGGRARTPTRRMIELGATAESIARHDRPSCLMPGLSAMRDWTAVPYAPLSGIDVAVVSPNGVVHRFDSLVPNSDTNLVDLKSGRWAVHNDSPCILRLQADSTNGYQHLITLCPSEKYRFDWRGEGCTLTAILRMSSQVFHRPSMDTDLYMQRAQALGLTKWEYLFYQYMVAARTACSRIPEGSAKTPDFTVSISGRTVPVELKEFAPNPEEKRNEELLRSRGYGDAHGTEVGHRIAKAARSARSQLRSFIDQNGDGPAILAVIDPSSLRYADPHHLAALFEGQLTLDVSVADGAIVDVYRKEDRRRSPHERNRVLSAVAVLRFCPKVGLAHGLESEPANPYVVADVVIYHNPQANYPLSARAVAKFGFSQYFIGAAEPPAVQVSSWPADAPLANPRGA